MVKGRVTAGRREVARERRGELDIRGVITKLTVWVREGAGGVWIQEGM